MNPAQPPVFLIGAARSGTTLIGDLLARHPEVAYWVEPKYVWRHGNPGAPDDVRTADEATPEVIAHIRSVFADFTRKAGRPRFLEKTPSNCFRVAFMHRVFPEGRFLHVLRHGEDTIASALGRWRSPPDDQAILRRIRRWEIPLTELPRYLPDIVREGLLRRLRPRKGYVWGPKYRGIHQDARTLDVPTLCARQWAQSVLTASRELGALPREQVFSFRYEEFVERPTQIFSAILEFAGLEPSDELLDATRHVRDRPGTFRALPEHEQRAISAVCAPVMRELGLAWGQVAADDRNRHRAVGDAEEGDIRQQ